MSTYTSYNSYLGNKLCCKTVCEEKCKDSSVSTGITGPTGPTGPTGATGAIQPTPTLQQVLTAGNTGTDKDIYLVNSVGLVTNTISSGGMSSTDQLTISSSASTVDITATANDINLNAGAGIYATATGSIDLTATNNDINFNATAGAISLTSSAGAITTTSDSVNMTTTNNGIDIISGVAFQVIATDGLYLTCGSDPMTLTGGGDINLTATTSLSGKINVNATNGVVVNKQGVVSPDTIRTTMDGNLIEIFDDQNTSTGIVNQTTIDPISGFLTDNTDNTAATQAYFRGTPSYMEIYDHTNSGTNTSRFEMRSENFNYFSSGTKPGYYQFQVSGNNIFRYNNSGIQMGTTGAGVNINLNNIKYPTSYNTSQTTLSTTSNAVQTFNITSGTSGCILPNASATNIGTQFIITNTNLTVGNSLGVTTFGGVQLIYSSTGAPSSVSRQLSPGHSHIFTAIQTTGASTYGWSMV
jgi:hypothetical protein